MHLSLRHFTAAALSLVLAVGFVACDSRSPTEPGQGQCTYTLSTTNLSFGASGGSGSVTVTTASGCTWTATSDRGWMTITSGANGTGNGVVSVSVSANSGDSVRTGALTIAGQAVSVREDPLEACTLSISPANAAHAADAATGSFSVSAPSHCQWTATAAVPWLRIASGSPGAGNGTIAYAVEANRDSSARSGGITVEQQTFLVNQAGAGSPPPPPPPPLCEYSVTPIQFTPCMASPSTLTAAITTAQGCTWTATAGASWISVTEGQSGSGPGNIVFRISENWDEPRQAVVMVRWPTVTAGQNLQVAQAGCRYSVSVDTFTVAAAGSSGQFSVYQVSDPIECGGPTQSACRWAAQSDVPWITVTTSMPQVGDNPVSFTVAANTGTVARSGSITVRNQVVRITQAGR